MSAIAAGSDDSLALKSNGTVVDWGCAIDLGQCNVPSGLSNVTAIAAGPGHSLALKSDGTVVAWGCVGYDYGQCSVPSDLTGVTAIAAGTFHSLALKQDGTVIAWGCGPSDCGQCSVPSDLSGVTAVAGNYDSIAVKADGTLVAWGCGGFDVGQCNVSDLSGVTDVAAAFGHTLALVGGPTNRPPNCVAVTAAPNSIWPRVPNGMALITLSGATDPDGDSIRFRIDGVTQDEYVTGIGDNTSPDAAFTQAARTRTRCSSAARRTRA